MRFPRYPRIVSPTLAYIVRLSQAFGKGTASQTSAPARRQFRDYQLAAKRRVETVVAPPAVGKSTARIVSMPPELGMGYGKP